MKKFMVIILLAVILLVGCQEVESDVVTSSKQEESTDAICDDREYLVSVTGFSDSTNAFELRKEYELRDYETYESYTPKQQIIYELNGKQYVCEYEGTLYTGNDYFPTYSYSDENGDFFGFDVDGNLKYCFIGAPKTEYEKLSQESCEKIATDFANKIFETEPYEKTVKVEKDGKAFRVTYKKIIGGIETTDTAEVVVWENGEIYSYRSFMLGKVAVDKPAKEISLEKIHAAVYKKLDELCDGAKDKFSKIEYSEPLVFLTVLKNGDIGYIVAVDVICIIENVGEMSERIIMVVCE